MDTEVPYKENKARELFYLGGSEGRAGRQVEGAHRVASEKPHAHGNSMEGRAKRYKDAVDRVMEQDTHTTTAMGGREPPI